MLRRTNWLLNIIVLLMFGILAACNGGGGGSSGSASPTPSPVSPSSKDITAFSINNVAGVINGTAITVSLPQGTVGTNFVATFTTTGTKVSVNGVDQVSGVTSNDFSQPVTYTVTAEDNSTQSYTVTVSISPTPGPTPPAPTADSVVSVYLLIDNLATLESYVSDLSKVDKVNFNRVIFSFVRPTIPNYTSGDLSNTGILGYFGTGDGNGVTAFNSLKSAISASRAKNIQTFISVGGWNYSCNYDVYGDKCGPSTDTYDWFPDPTDSTQATTATQSYNNIIKLANDLGVDGIDLDYEEFWHADKYAVKWNGNPNAYSVAKLIEANGGPTYANLTKFGDADTPPTPNVDTAMMPMTIDKLHAIISTLEGNSQASHLMFATAAPPVGARPIMGWLWGDGVENIVNTQGGVWYLGNLKGLWYNLTMMDKSAVDRFDSLGLMTYDLCGDNAQTCAPYTGAQLDLPSQVTAYVNDYSNWLKSTQVKDAHFEYPNTWSANFFPATFNINPKIQFGFEVNQPAYPKNVSGQLQLTKSLVTTILTQQATKTNGVIIWQMYSAPNDQVTGHATSNDTLNQSCNTFLKSDSRYDCNSTFPASAGQ